MSPEAADCDSRWGSGRQDFGPEAAEQAVKAGGDPAGRILGRRLQNRPWKQAGIATQGTAGGLNGPVII